MGLFRETQNIDQNSRNLYKHPSATAKEGKENRCNTISTDSKCENAAAAATTVGSFENKVSFKDTTNHIDPNSNTNSKTFDKENMRKTFEQSGYPSKQIGQSLEKSGSATEQFASKVTNNSSEVTSSSRTLLQALRAFFSSTSSSHKPLLNDTEYDNPIKGRSHSTESSGECLLPRSSVSSTSGVQSSGYGSFDASCEIDQSYIKVSKFSGKVLLLYFFLYFFLFSTFQRS